jgi:hypothetical protein
MTREVDWQNSPAVSVFSARARREILWTLCEVHFLASRSGRAGRLYSVKRRFETWIRGFELVHSPTNSAFDYFLEGSAASCEAIWASPSAASQLRAGRYFVCDDDNDFVLDRLARKLALRGLVGVNGNSDGRT